MRIASLVPSSTEMLFALGLGDQVVGVTHECDWPPRARELPHLTRTVIPHGLPPGEIDARVREQVNGGSPLYELDSETLERLRPDLIVAQQLCAVCAVSYEEVCDIAGALPGPPDTISLDPESLEEVLDDVLALGEATGRGAAARTLRQQLEERLERVREAVDGSVRPRVAALEWLDPPFLGGHWVPEMIEIAGGTDPLGVAAQKSRTATWEEVRAAKPEVAVLMQCGYYAAEAAAEAAAYADQLRGLGTREVWAVDAAAGFSRPGPRLVEGTELLASILHPNLVRPPEGLGARMVEL